MHTTIIKTNGEAHTERPTRKMSDDQRNLSRGDMSIKSEDGLYVCRIRPGPIMDDASIDLRARHRQTLPVSSYQHTG